MRIIYFTTLVVPQKGVRIVLFNKNGITGTGTIEDSLVRDYELENELKYIARNGTGQGIIKILSDGGVEINQAVRDKSLPNIKFPYPRYRKNQSHIS